MLEVVEGVVETLLYLSLKHKYTTLVPDPQIATAICLVFSFSFMCICVWYACAYTWVVLFVCKCTCRIKVDIRLLSASPRMYWGRITELNPELTTSTNLSSQFLQAPLSIPSVQWNYRWEATLSQNMFQGSKLWFSWLPRKSLTTVPFPWPFIYYFKLWNLVVLFWEANSPNVHQICFSRYRNISNFILNISIICCKFVFFLVL